MDASGLKWAATCHNDCNDLEEDDMQTHSTAKSRHIAVALQQRQMSKKYEGATKEQGRLLDDEHDQLSNAKFKIERRLCDQRGDTETAKYKLQVALGYQSDSPIVWRLIESALLDLSHR